MQRVFGLVLGYADLNDHDELRRSHAGRGAAQGRRERGNRGGAPRIAAKPWPARARPTAWSWTAPTTMVVRDQRESDKPETKKIVVDPESIDALLVDLFLEAHTQAPDQIILDLDATDDRLFGHQEVALLSRLSPGLLLSATVRVLRGASAGVRPLAAIQHRCLLPIRWRNWSRWWRASSPKLAGRQDPRTRRRRPFLPGATDGVAERAGLDYIFLAGTESAFAETDRGGEGASWRSNTRKPSARAPVR